MRIIYEDGSYRNENNEEVSLSDRPDSFIDISSMSEEQKREKEEEERIGKPYRPAATLRPALKEEEKPQQEVPQQIQPQGYPVQYVPVQYPYPQYPQGYVYTHYPQGYPVQPPQGYPVQYPQGYPEQYMQMVSQPLYRPVDSDVPDAGTRVLYQSPDFERKETTAPPAAPVRPVYAVGSGITLSDVEPSGYRAPIQKNTSFDVDDVEMSVFELNSFSYKHPTTSKQISKPYASGSSLEIEEYDERFDELSDYEDEEEKSVVSKKKSTPNQKKSESEKDKKGKKTTKKNKSDMPRKVVLAVSVIAMVVSIAVLMNEARLSKENQDMEQEVSDLIIDVPVSDEAPSDEEPAGEDEGDKDKDKDEEKDKEKEEEEVVLTPEQQWEKVKSEYPNVVFPSDIQLKYAKLYATNREFVGYLSAPGVNLNLPVVQTDDDETYLKKNFYGKNTKYGCPFVTHLNQIGSTRESLDTNTVIFGHYMKDGSVFGNLFKYKTIDGFKAAPVIEFNTLYHDYQWKIIAAFITNADEKDDNGYVFKYYFTNLSTRDRYSAFLSELSQRSIYDTGVDVLPDDKILTLSTCSYEFENARFVVVARLVRFGESPEVDTSKATVNPKPRYPQAYYDKKKQNNPYKDAYRWEVG